MKRQFLYSVLLWVGLLAVLIWPVSLTLADPVAIPQDATMVPVGEITRGITVRQQLPAPGTALSSVSLLLGTYRRTLPGSLEITIEIVDRDGRWIPISRTSVALTQIPDTAPYTLTFSPPLPIPPTEHLAIALSSDALQGEAIVWWAAPTWTKSGYQLFVNQQMVASNAIMTANYAGIQGPLLTMLPAIWQRITVFLDPLWQGMLLVALIIGIGAGGIFLLRW
jgi:hypothetical protein